MKKLYKKKNKIRQLLLQNLYSIELNKKIINNDLVFEKINKNKTDITYLITMLNKINEKDTILKLIINNNAKENININILDMIILKIALYEIMYEKNLPIKVILNESINLAKQFCDKNSYTLINKILNNILNNL